MHQTQPNPLDLYHGHFGLLEQHVDESMRNGLHVMRKSALKRFSELGFPTNRDEEWRFTNVGPIRDTRMVPGFALGTPVIREKDISPFLLRQENGVRLTFVNGRFVHDLSSPPTQYSGVKAGSLATAIETDWGMVEKHLVQFSDFESDVFATLNTAFVRDGAFIVVDNDVQFEPVIHLLFVSTKHDETFVCHPRNLIVVGNGAKLSLVESYAGLSDARYFTNTVTQIRLGERAILEHDKFQMESPNAFHVGSSFIRMDGGCSYTSNAISLGGSIVRNNIGASLEGEGCECTLNGLALGTGNQLVDNHTTIDHAKPACASHELYKSILDGKAHGVFNGKIFVRKDAQKTDAKQTNKTLLLSDEATIDTKPQLEIFADDVKCTHGAAVGQLDDDQIFYLRARGIDLEAARDLLTFAFANDVIQRIHVVSLRERLDAMIRSKLRLGRLEQQTA